MENKEVVETEQQNPEVENSENKSADTLIKKAVENKAALDNIDREIKSREAQLSSLREERLRLQGSYRSLLELGVQLGYITLENNQN